MTDVRDSLQDQLRSLREARLPDGFEEKLELRLAAAERELHESAPQPWKLRRGLFLLAAIAVPTAAFAAGSWWMVHSLHKPAVAVSSAPPIESLTPAEHNPRTALTQPAALPTETANPPTPAAPAIEKPSLAHTVRPHVGVNRKSAVAKAVTEAEQSAQTAAARRGPVQIESLEPATERKPAKIESLEPAARASSGGNEQPASRLERSSASQSLRSSTARSTLGSSTGNAERRGAAAERRDNESAQQARERVQLRERKGQ
jgi:hypothetical protein